MTFRTLRKVLSRSHRGSSSRNKLQKPNPEAEVHTPRSTVPDYSEGGFVQQPGEHQHPAIRPLDSKPSPRQSSFEPPLENFAALSVWDDSVVDDQPDRHALGAETAGGEAPSEESVGEESSGEEMPSERGHGEETFVNHPSQYVAGVSESTQSPRPPSGQSQDTDWDYTLHTRPPVIQQDIRPHVHTIYQPRRTRSIHYHEHRYIYQPIIDTDQHHLPEQHWIQDETTGRMFPITNNGQEQYAVGGLPSEKEFEPAVMGDEEWLLKNEAKPAKSS